MARTTVDIDLPTLRKLKERQQREHKTLGRVVSELLAQALADERPPEPAGSLTWVARPLGPARVDLEDKEAVYAVLDRE